MSPYDNVGRISKVSFVVSSVALFAFNILAIAARLCIKRWLAEGFSADDGCILIGLCSLITALVILFVKVLDNMYLAEALILGEIGLGLPADFMQRAFDFQKWSAILLGLTWFTIMAVKFSFLLFFRRLIDRIKPLKIYWWFVVFFCVVILFLGCAMYYFVCPYFYSLESMSCNGGGSRQGRVMGFSIAKTIVDLFSDIIILVIPLRLIWKVKVNWRQKLGLSMSLCLLLIVIIATIIRASGLRRKGAIDVVWQVYWFLICAQMGLFLAAATSFRSFFVFRANENRSGRHGSSHSSRYFWNGGIFSPKKWYSKQRSEASSWKNSANRGKQHQDGGNFNELANIPRGQLTGARTFIEALGRTHDDEEPLNAKGIRITRSFSSRAEEARTPPSAAHPRINESAV